MWEWQRRDCLYVRKVTRKSCSISMPGRSSLCIQCCQLFTEKSSCTQLKKSPEVARCLNLPKVAKSRQQWSLLCQKMWNVCWIYFIFTQENLMGMTKSPELMTKSPSWQQWKALTETSARLRIRAERTESWLRQKILLALPQLVLQRGKTAKKNKVHVYWNLPTFNARTR